MSLHPYWIAVASGNNIFILDEQYKVLRTLQGHTDRVISILQLQNGLLVSAAKNSMINMWDIESGRCCYSWQTPIEDNNIFGEMEPTDDDCKIMVASGIQYVRILYWVLNLTKRTYRQLFIYEPTNILYSFGTLLCRTMSVSIDNVRLCQHFGLSYFVTFVCTQTHKNIFRQNINNLLDPHLAKDVQTIVAQYVIS